MDTNNTLDDKEKSHRRIILMICSSCNLNCKYCYQQKKTDGLMSFSTFCAVLNKEFHNCKAGDVLSIDYFGGEPFMNFKLIQEGSAWLWGQSLPFEIRLNVQTNGTLLDDSMRDWFLKNRTRIEVGLSMDGLSQMNKINRTSRVIDWQFFHKMWPQSKLNIVLYPDTVHLLHETVLELNKAGLPFDVTIGGGFHWSERVAHVLEEQLLLLVDAYISRPYDGITCGLFSKRISDFFPQYPIQSMKFCGRHDNIIAYDTDGSPCICHVFTTPVVGYAQARETWSSYREIDSVPYDLVCQSCPIHKNCTYCFGDNYRLHGDIKLNSARDTVCFAIKAQARASAAFFLKGLEYKQKNRIPVSKEEIENGKKALRLLESMPINGSKEEDDTNITV